MVEGEINLLDCLRVLVKNKKLIILVCLIITMLAIVYSLYLPKIYKAECSLMPVGGGDPSGMAQLAMAQLGGGVMGLGKVDASNRFLAIIRSKTLAERVIKRLDLMPTLYPQFANKLGKPPTLVGAIDTLQGIVTVNEDKKSHLITITVLIEHPEDAARIANGYLDELIDFISENTFTSAKRNRIFLERQLERNKVELLNSGKELNSFYATNKISNVVPSLDVDVSPRQEDQSLESNGEEGPDKISDEATQLQNKLEATKVQFQQAHIVKDVPQQIYLQYLVIQRELLGKLNVLLSQQYAMAKIDESKEDISFQVIDRAMVPVKRFKPQRKRTVMVGFLSSILLGGFCAFSREYLEKMKSNQATV